MSEEKEKIYQNEDIEVTQAEVIVSQNILPPVKSTDFGVIEAELIAKINEFSNLEIKSIDDKDGYKKVKEGAKTLTSIRTQIVKRKRSITSEARNYIENVNEMANRLIAITKPVEEELTKKFKFIDEEKVRIKREEELRKEKLIQDRINEIIKLGGSYNGVEYQLGDVIIEIWQIRGSNDEEFRRLIDAMKQESQKIQAIKEEEEKIKALKKAEEERKKKELEEQIEKERKEKEELLKKLQEAENEKKKAEEARLKAEQERIKKQEEEKKEKERREKYLYSIGMTFDGNSFVYHAPDESETVKLSDVFSVGVDTFESLAQMAKDKIQAIKKRIDDERKQKEYEAEQKRLEQIRLQKEKEQKEKEEKEQAEKQRRKDVIYSLGVKVENGILVWRSKFIEETFQRNIETLLSISNFDQEIEKIRTELSVLDKKESEAIAEEKRVNDIKTSSDSKENKVFNYVKSSFGDANESWEVKVPANKFLNDLFEIYKS